MDTLFQREQQLEYLLSHSTETQRCGQHLWISIQIVFYQGTFRDAIRLRFFHFLQDQGTVLVSNWELFSLSGKFTGVIQFMSLVFELHIKWDPDITKYKKYFVTIQAAHYKE